MTTEEVIRERFIKYFEELKLVHNVPSVTDFAIKIDINRQTINKILNREKGRFPTLELLSKIAKVYPINFNYILIDIGKPLETYNPQIEEENQTLKGKIKELEKEKLELYSDYRRVSNKNQELNDELINYYRSESKSQKKPS